MTMAIYYMILITYIMLYIYDYQMIAMFIGVEL